MNLTLSRRGDYVLRSAIHLGHAFATGESLKLRQVAAEMGIPRTFVSQILGDLVHAGLAVSSPGSNGGYRLARAPETVTLLELVEAGEGSLAQQGCVLGEGPCHWQRVCPLHESWTAMGSAVREVLVGTTLADLVERDRRLHLGTYPVPLDSHRPQALGMDVSDSVQIEVASAVVAARLRSGGAWLAPYLDAASAEGEAIRVRVGPGGPSWFGKTVAARLGEPIGGDDDLVVGLSWQATGPSGLFPRFDGELQLRAVDDDRSELHLAGRYRPPLGSAGQMLDEALLARVAKATVRSLLRRVARSLEATAPAAEALRDELRNLVLLSGEQAQRPQVSSQP